MKKKLTFIPRIIPIKKLIEHKSLLLLGPRQTGKSRLIKEAFPDSRRINLLLNSEYLRYQKDPSLLTREFVGQEPTLVVIDEIQRIPELLNEVHYLIEECEHRFLLTGSSARKLKKSGTNLLGGRASKVAMHPFVREELQSAFDLEKALSFGLLPSVYLSKDPKSELEDYVGVYLKEEILAEGLTRNLPAFSRFLEVAASVNSKMINYTKIAQDAQLAPSTTYEHFRLLEDTLLGKEVLAFTGSSLRKAVSTSKFYFFDLGVVRSLLGRGAIKKTDADFGDFFESYIFHELNAYTSYRKLPEVKYWRSKSNFEVDFIYKNEVAIEVKSTKRVSKDDLKGLIAFSEEKVMQKYILVSFDPVEQTWEGVCCMPWAVFLDRLAADEI